MWGCERRRKEEKDTERTNSGAMSDASSTKNLILGAAALAAGWCSLVIAERGCRMAKMHQNVCCAGRRACVDRRQRRGATARLSSHTRIASIELRASRCSVSPAALTARQRLLACRWPRLLLPDQGEKREKREGCDSRCWCTIWQAYRPSGP